MNNIEIDFNSKTVIIKANCFPKEQELEQLIVLNEIREIKLYNQSVISMPSWLDECDELELLTFNDEKGNIQVIEDPIGFYPVFKSAIENKYDYISQNILELQNIREISYWFIPTNSFLKSLPSSIGDLSNLICLELAEQSIESIPSSLANCQYLETLNLHGNPIKKIPNEIFKLENLRYLSIGSNKVKIEIDDINKFGNFEQLHSLSLKNCGLKTFPTSIENLNDLVSISLEDNEIHELPSVDEITNAFPNLEVINLRGNLLYDQNYDKYVEWLNDIRRTNILIY